MPTSSQGGGYRRREPDRTLLYRVVAAELEALREELSATSPLGGGLPRAVERELDGYLRCGILAHGFARVACRRCRAEHLVGFSCKGRGICPSCTARRMSDTAAHLVDRVLPRVPVRQWVATFPRRVRYHLADDPKLATRALREVLRVVFAFQRRRARRLGARPDRAHSNGAVTFVQRFNSALELSLHFHILIPDGVFVRSGEDIDARPRFVEIPPPTDDEVAALLDRVIARVLALLRRHGRLDDDARDEEPAPHLLFAARTPPGGERFVEDPLPPRCARKDGFSLHAGAATHANDRLGLERLARYGLRPPLAQGRLSEAPDGTLRYEMKRRFSDGRRVLRFTPRELVLRLCALVPPRGFHMVRYAGVFAAHARGRHALTGRGLLDRPHLNVALPPTPEPSRDTSGSRDAPPSTDRPPHAAPPRPLPHATPPRISKHAVPPHDEHDEPMVHGADAACPDDAARPRRLDWAALLKRCFAVDVLVCPRCRGPMHIVAFIEDPRITRRILEHLGLQARPPPRPPPGQPLLSRARSTDLDGIDPPLILD